MTDKNRECDYDTLLEKAKAQGSIPENALQAIRRQLVSGSFETDLYTLIHILGKSGDRISLPILEKYLDFGLDSPDDDNAMIRRITLQVIGRMWAIPEAFDIAAQRAFNDPSPYVRSVAATIIGFLGARNESLKPIAARLLLQGLKQHDPEEPELWESFYQGLLELFDVPIREWPLMIGEMKESDVRQDLIIKANEILKRV